MSLVSYAGKLLRRAGGLAKDVACCCNWVCSWNSNDPAAGKDCYRKGTEPDPSLVVSSHATEAQCDYTCGYEWVCSVNDATGVNECYRAGEEPYPDPSDVKYDTEKECREQCEYWVCAWNSQSDPSAGKDCYRKGQNPGQIVSEHASEDECKRLCLPDIYVCSYKSNDTSLGKKCYKGGEEPDPTLIVNSYDSLDECYRDCYDGSWSCILDDKDEYVCVKTSEVTEYDRVLANHASKEDCLKQCGDQWVCSRDDASPIPGKRKCFPYGDEPDPADDDTFYSSESECKAECEATYVCAYRSPDPVDGKKCYKLGDELDPSLIIDSYDTIDECYSECYDGMYSCIDIDGDYDCVPTSSVPTSDFPLVVANYITEEECRRKCYVERGSCCIKSECECIPNSTCTSAYSYWEKDGDTGPCVEVTKTSSDADEVWVSDGCFVYRGSPSSDASKCGDESSGWRRIGFTLDGCDFEPTKKQPCYDDYTEKECADAAGKYEFVWTPGGKCSGEAGSLCDCSGFNCVITVDLLTGLIDTKDCKRVYQFNPDYKTSEECEECNWSICGGEYDWVTGEFEYTCTPWKNGDDVNNRRTNDDCDMTCCIECRPCGVFSDGVLPPGSYGDCDSYSVSTTMLNPADWNLIESAPEKSCTLVLSDGSLYESKWPAIHDFFAGQWIGDSAKHFSPCYSPALPYQYLNSKPDDNYQTVVIPIHDPCDCADVPWCTGSGPENCDCGWADYELALELERRNYKLRIWQDYSIHAETTTDAACYCHSTTSTHYFKFRAFIYNCDTGKWMDYTKELLKRPEMKLVTEGYPDFDWPSGNQNLPCSTQSPDTDGTPSGDLPPPAVFVDPKEPEIQCLTAINPLP